MKKIVSLVLTIVLMASMFAMLGTVTASAETYYATNVLVNLTFDGDAPYGVPAHRGDFKSYTTDTDGNGVLFIQQSDSNGAVFFIGKDGTVGEKPVNAYANAGDVKTDEFVWFEATKTYRVAFDYKYLKGTGEGAGLGNNNNKPYTPTGSNTSLIRLFTDPTKAHNKAPNNDATFGHVFENRVTVISQVMPTATWEPDENGQLGADTEWKKAEIVFTVKENDPGFVMSMHPGTQGITKAYYDNIVVQEVVGSYDYNESDVYTLDDQPAFTKASGPEGTYVENYEDHGTVLKVEGDAVSNRGGFKVDDFKVEKGKKYYISFEAKADAAGEIVNVLCDYAAPLNRRHFMSGHNSKYQGVKYFINGNEITVNAGNTKNVMPVTTEWQTYGLIIDTADEGFLDAVLSNDRENAHYIKFWNYNIYYMFGSNTTTYFDNFKIVEMTEPAISAVPEKDESAKYSIRETAAGTTAGLRFRGSVANTAKEAADEIGFVLAPVSLVGNDANWYKLDSLNKFAKKAVAYDGTKDVVYAPGTETTAYQLILTGLDKLAAQRFAAVMYVKTGDTYDYISLGEISYNQVLAEYAVRAK